ncbi:hypothetical protein I7I53_06300 [Histoplasma capsulatum var. duboisii H88]|uniref:Uncharacterized protein n=1 Tax=Ajellomyces capsulatus (strain H88) TaxID=544711 RepID=A0A8A1LDY1_AJEC8|nr:hypothetical protein I7I53_06300 [Histoplasma capsulatum var. duboisii H88]
MGPVSCGATTEFQNCKGKGASTRRGRKIVKCQSSNSSVGFNEIPSLQSVQDIKTAVKLHSQKK